MRLDVTDVIASTGMEMNKVAKRYRGLLEVRKAHSISVEKWYDEAARFPHPC